MAETFSGLYPRRSSCLSSEARLGGSLAPLIGHLYPWRPGRRKASEFSNDGDGDGDGEGKEMGTALTKKAKEEVEDLRRFLGVRELIWHLALL